MEIIMNKAIIRNQIVEIKYEGVVAVEDVIKMNEEVQRLVTTLQENNKKVLLLIDATEVEKASQESRTKSVEFMKAMHFDKIAIFGASVFQRHVINFVVTATGNQRKIRHFKEKSDALVWLKA